MGCKLCISVPGGAQEHFSLRIATEGTLILCNYSRGICGLIPLEIMQNVVLSL